MATNALIERRGATVALVTTSGFADVIEIARQDRASLYDIWADRAEPLVRRELRLEVDGRLDGSGREIEPVGRPPTIPEGVEAVAVCLLHADLNPAHERLVTAALVTGKVVEAHVWETLRDLIPGRWVPSDVHGVPGATTNDDRLQIQQLLLTFALQRWLDLGDVHVLASWGDDGGAVDFGRDSLFGALALQLALTATRHGGFFRCSHCGDAYIPERRPREGEEHYCHDCREKKVPGRRRMEKLRQRKALEQQPPEEG